jgi:hypothetical protein
MERTKFTTQPLPQLYNVEDEPIVLSKCLLDILLKQPNCSDLIALYTFYYYTAKWQKTNQPKSTADYTAQGMGWSIKRVKRCKKRLIEIGLIESIVSKNMEGKVSGHFVKINFVWQVAENQRGLFPLGGESTHKCLRTNNKSITTTKKINSARKIIPPPLEMVQKYCQERKNGIDPQHFMDYYISKDWMVGRVRMKDWQATIRNWERTSKKDNLKNKPPYKEWDGRRYYLQPDGEYRNKKGTLYVE